MIGWVGHVARIGENTNADRVWWGNPTEEKHQENLGTDGRIIPKQS
jgi:hypothetical protein